MEEIKATISGEAEVSAAFIEPTPNGGGSYTLPPATSSALGGVKADPKTAGDTQPVRIGTDGKLYTAQGGGGDRVSVVQKYFGGVDIAEIKINDDQSYVLCAPDGGGEGKINYLDATNFKTTNTNNWGLVTTKTSVDCTHKTQWITGYPTMDINIPAGSYVFEGRFETDGGILLKMTKNGSFYRDIVNGTTFQIEQDSAYQFFLTSQTAGAHITITDMSITLIPVASTTSVGAVKAGTGVSVSEDGSLFIQSNWDSQLNDRANRTNQAVTLGFVDKAVTAVLTDGKAPALTDEQKAAAQSWLGIDTILGLVNAVSEVVG